MIRAEAIFVAMALKPDIGSRAVEDLDRHEEPFSGSQALKARAEILGELSGPAVSLGQFFL